MSDPRISITIAHWNRFDVLARCLASVERCDPEIPREILVVDNASSDDSVARIRAEHPRVRLIENPENRGFGTAHNQAIREARAPFVLILNNDCELEPGCLQHFLDFMETHPRAGIASCQIVTHPGADPLPAGGTRDPTLGSIAMQNLLMYSGLAGLRRRSRRRDGGTSSLAGPDPRETHELAHVGGAVMFSRKEALDAVGGFDEAFFLYMEETDLCRRVRGAGWTVMYTPGARVVHEGSVCGQLMPGRPAIHRRSTAWYLRKHQGPLAAWGYWIQEALVGVTLKPMFHLARRLRGAPRGQGPGSG